MEIANTTKEVMKTTENINAEANILTTMLFFFSIYVSLTFAIFFFTIHLIFRFDSSLEAFEENLQSHIKYYILHPLFTVLFLISDYDLKYTEKMYRIVLLVSAIDIFLFTEILRSLSIPKIKKIVTVSFFCSWMCYFEFEPRFNTTVVQ